MTRPRHSETTNRHARQEKAIDDMVEQTFPASDATQLPGRAADAPESGAKRGAPKGEFPPQRPGTIGNQGVAPSTRMKEETVRLGGDAAVTFRFDADARRLWLRLGDEGTMLDAVALDRLIEALSKKRARMGD